MSRQHIMSEDDFEHWNFEPPSWASARSIVVQDDFLAYKEVNGMRSGIRMLNLVRKSIRHIDPGLNVALFAFDVTQDLLVLVESFSEDGYLMGVNVHLRQLSLELGAARAARAPRHHSRPLLYRVTTKPTERSSQLFGQVQIVGNLVGVVVSSEELHESGDTTVSVWDWTTGTQRVCLSNRLFTNFVFMSTNRILVSHKVFWHEPDLMTGPAILVYDFGNQDLTNTAKYRCALSLRPKSNTPDTKAYYLRTDPSALRGGQSEFLICMSAHQFTDPVDQSLSQGAESRSTHNLMDESSAEDIENQVRVRLSSNHVINQESNFKTYLILARNLQSIIESLNTPEQGLVPPEAWLRLFSEYDWSIGFISGARTLELFRENNPSICLMISDYSRPGTQSMSLTPIPVDDISQYAGFLTKSAAVVVRMWGAEKTITSIHVLSGIDTLSPDSST